jgi:hypothetical protein
VVKAVAVVVEVACARCEDGFGAEAVGVGAGGGAGGREDFSKGAVAVAGDDGGGTIGEGRDVAVAVVVILNPAVGIEI